MTVIDCGKTKCVYNKDNSCSQKSIRISATTVKCMNYEEPECIEEKH